MTKHAICGILMMALLAAGQASAKTPDAITPAGETICDQLKQATPGLYGLCVAFCEAKDCEPEYSSDAPDGEYSRSCGNLLRNYDRKKAPGDPGMPCLAQVETLYAGTGSRMDGTARVLRYDGAADSFVDISGGGIADMVFDLVRFEGDLYAALYDKGCGTADRTTCSLDYYRQEQCTTEENFSYDCAKVARYMPETGDWEPVGGDLSGYSYRFTTCFFDGPCEEFEVTLQPEESTKVYVTELEVYQGSLYAVTHNGYNGGSFFRLDGDAWTRVDELNVESRGLTALGRYGGALYTGDVEAGRILRYDDLTASLEPVLDGDDTSTWDFEEYLGLFFAAGSEGLVLTTVDGTVWDEWPSGSEGDVWDLEVHDGILYLGRQGSRDNPGGYMAELWAYDGRLLQGPIWEAPSHNGLSPRDFGILSMAGFGENLAFGTGAYFPIRDNWVTYNTEGRIFFYDPAGGGAREVSDLYHGGIQVIYNDGAGEVEPPGDFL